MPGRSPVNGVNATSLGLSRFAVNPAMLGVLDLQVYLRLMTYIHVYIDLSLLAFAVVTREFDGGPLFIKKL